MTIFADEMLPMILRAVPDFGAAWQAHVDYWQGKSAGVCGDMQAFTGYVIDGLRAGAPLDMAAIFGLIEALLVDGDEQVSTAAATCFLEDLLNNADAGQIDYDWFMPWLGPASRRYCDAWDDFSNSGG